MPSAELMMASSLSMGVGPAGCWPEEEAGLLLVLLADDTAAAPACTTENTCR